jgi:radical SAM superfamily enzyme YgiQ (UPF0313 family)
MRATEATEDVTAAPGAATPRSLFLYPQFRSASFWNYRATCDLLGAKYPAAPLGLITVAALLPKSWEVRLVDCNVDGLDDADIEWADLVFIGAMLPQQSAALELIEALQRRGKTVIVGGPDPTSSPHVYARADHLVLGEAEITLPRWLADFQAGAAERVYECGDSRANLLTSPLPRFDLLKFDRYLHIGVQFARGCPFRCEFCDIIELFGRVPRLKSAEQMLAELEHLANLGYRGHVDFVDDNFIGNKREVKKFLAKLHRWLQQHRWPFEFSTEASVNLADDDELLTLMQDVGFCSIFVGIESPDETTLRASQKHQNTKRSLADSLHKIYSYGMIVNTGYIVGFDTERGDVARGVLDMIEASAVPVNMVGLLFALPNTQLQRRLAIENRLHEDFDRAPADIGDQCLGGLNFETARPRVDVLRDYQQIVSESYAPRNYFNRVLRVVVALNCSRKQLKQPWHHLWRNTKGVARLVCRMGIRRRYRGLFWRTLVGVAWHNPRGLRYAIALMALYLHFGEFRSYLVGRLESGIWRAEEAVSAALPAVQSV